ncbi:MAG: rhomboid family intramembrane serine protease [Elusimicrobia bacterium]|nr:rhomboid family intramembrane serine protease [Elusimicrobiota bacterium]
MTRIFRHDPIDFRNLPPAIRMLMIANLVGFVAALVVGPELNQLFGLVPQQVVFQRWIWQPVTYLFLHGNMWHLIFNLFALWMFGMPVESQWGERDFLKYYFLCGLGAAGAHLALAPHSPIPVIGASGSVYGLLVAFAMLYPDAVVYLYFLIPIKAAHMAILFGAIEFFAGASGTTPGVARFAHLGGMITGYLYIRWWWVAKLQLKSLWRRAVSAEPEDEEAPPRPVARRPAKPKASAPDAEMAEVDRILDKILSDGLGSLTDEEKNVMHKYSERNKPS